MCSIRCSESCRRRLRARAVPRATARPWMRASYRRLASVIPARTTPGAKGGSARMPGFGQEGRRYSFSFSFPSLVFPPSVAEYFCPYRLSLRKIRRSPAETARGSNSLPVRMSHTREWSSWPVVPAKACPRGSGGGNPETFVIEVDSRFRGNDGLSRSPLPTRSG